ncbi:MAG: reverse transcriptase family protein [Candidatus Thiodiazotropha sp.]
MVSFCEIVDDDVLNVSRHRPVICEISTPITCFSTGELSNVSHIKWNRISTTELEMYSSRLAETLDNVDYSNVPYASDRIQQRYDNIVCNIISCSDEILPKTKFRRFLKPYWDQSLKDLHAIMRQARRLWIAEGRPRGNNYDSYRQYKRAKCLFRSQHRKCAEKYLASLNAEIDQIAEIDSAYFWKKINGRRKLSLACTGSEIEFRGHIYRDPEEITLGWGEYFRDLYSDTERIHFDPLFKNIVDSRVQEITDELSSCPDRDSIVFSVSDIKSVIKDLKSKKACGRDGVYNEHLIYGGITLYRELSILFTDMFNFGFIPSSLKQGVIITLHKGGRKSKKDPNNYRAITLTSCILKLFERLILRMLYDDMEKPFNILQGGFRPLTGCNMSSLMLKECILYAKEHQSKLFACFLDVQKAFDKVWHNGLFLKLYNMGIRSKLLRVVIDLHCNLTSTVFHDGYHSDCFPVLQGTRQGGVISPFMYLCFVDELLNELNECGVGFKVDGMSLASPTVCDDMLLLSLSKNSLDNLMHICYRYSCLWRYDYSPSKSAVIVFNETKYYYKKHRRVWYLGPNEVTEGENYKHLGVNCNKYSDLSVNLKESVDKLKGTFMSLANCGLINELNPVTCKNLYYSVVLPKALYGCECWSNLSSGNILILERAHRFCVKYMQGFNIRTRTDIALGLLGMYSLESEIDFRKLNLFGQLCRNDTQCWITPLFRSRLKSYFENKYDQKGFLPDIIKLLEKYGLIQYIEVFRTENVFPGKFAWKRLLRQSICQNEVAMWHDRMNSSDFSLFYRLHNVHEPHYLWRTAKEYPQYFHCYKSVMQMIATISNNFTGPFICSYCNSHYDNRVFHCIYECSYLKNERAILWNDICRLNTGIYTLLRSLDRSSQLLALLGEKIVPLFDILGDNVQVFWHICIVNLDKMWSKYCYRRMV